MAVGKPTAAQQALIDQAVQAALAEAQKGLVTAVSKPDMINNLRSTWRSSAEHGAEQVKRFLRLTVVAAIPAVVSAIVAATTAHTTFDWKTLLALIVPFAETAYRQVFPALGAAAVDSAPGVTIVPDQVASTDPAPADPTVAPVTPDPAVPDVVPPAEGDAAP